MPALTVLHNYQQENNLGHLIVGHATANPSSVKAHGGGALSAKLFFKASFLIILKYQSPDIGTTF